MSSASFRTKQADLSIETIHSNIHSILGKAAFSTLSIYSSGLASTGGSICRPTVQNDVRSYIGSQWCEVDLYMFHLPSTLESARDWGRTCKSSNGGWWTWDSRGLIVGDRPGSMLQFDVDARVRVNLQRAHQSRIQIRRAGQQVFKDSTSIRNVSSCRNSNFMGQVWVGRCVSLFWACYCVVCTSNLSL